MTCKAAQALALVLSLLGSTSALSSTSPLDLFAHPRYQIVLTQAGVSNATASELLAQTPSAGDAVYHLMRTKAGQGFLCSVPPASSVSVEPSQAPAPESRKPRTQEEQRAGLEKGLSLLEPLKDSCLYLRQGWFTYTFCHGSQIRQFHEVKQAGSHLPVEDTNYESYTLGQYSQPSAEVASSATTGNLQEVLAGVNPAAALDELGEERRYLVQRWRGGTMCDKTGLERSVEVQGADRIAFVRETAICEYLMVVYTPRLCAEPTFLGNDNDPLKSAALVTRCQPILNAALPASEEPAEAAAAVEPIPEAVEPEAQIEAVDAEPAAEQPTTEATASTEPAVSGTEDGGEVSESTEAVASAIQDLLDTSELAADLVVMLDPETGEVAIEQNEEAQPFAEVDLERMEKFSEVLKETMAEALKIFEGLKRGEALENVAANAKKREMIPPPGREQKAAVQRPPPVVGSPQHQRMARLYGKAFDGSSGEETEEGGMRRQKDEL